MQCERSAWYARAAGVSRLPDPPPTILCRVGYAAVRERTLPNDDDTTLPLRAAGPTAARISATDARTRGRYARVCRHHNLVSERGGDCRWLRTRDEDLGLDSGRFGRGIASGLYRRGKRLDQ